MTSELSSKCFSGEARFVRQAGPPGRYGHVVLTLQRDSKSGIHFSWEVCPDEIPEYFRDAVQKGVAEAPLLERLRAEGVLVRILGGSSHPTDSNEGSYVIAAYMAAKAALDKVDD